MEPMEVRWPFGPAVNLPCQPPHAHDFDEYFVVVQGCYTLIIDGKRIPVSAGEEYFIPKGTWHSGEGPCRYTNYPCLRGSTCRKGSSVRLPACKLTHFPRLSQRPAIMRKGTPRLIASALGLLLAACASSPAKTIRFVGYEWIVKSGTHEGPGPNDWNENNVWVDQNGYLHLKLTQQGDRWYCAEVLTKDRLGFGRYQFWVVGRLDRLDPNVVLGLFNYPTPQCRTGWHQRN